MAEGTFYIRPSADISLGHPVYPETLGAGYLAISEQVSDGTSTYIGVTSAPDADVSYSSSFTMNLEDEAKITKVLSATLKVGFSLNAPSSTDRRSRCNCSVAVSGETVFDEYLEDQYLMDGTKRTIGDLINGDNDISSLVSKLNSHIETNGAGSLPEIRLNLTNSAGMNNGTKSLGKSYVTWACIELSCEYSSDIGVHRKINDSWVAATAAYQKQNGSWVEITEDECKTILQSSLCGKIT